MTHNQPFQAVHENVDRSSNIGFSSVHSSSSGRIRITEFDLFWPLPTIRQLKCHPWSGTIFSTYKKEIRYLLTYVNAPVLTQFYTVKRRGDVVFNYY